MTQYNVTLHKLFNGIIPELSQRQEVEIAASDRESAGKQAAASFGGEGWVVTNVELLGGPESENVKSADKLMEVAGELADEIKTRQRLERKLAEQIRINEKTAANCNKARKRRKAAEKQLEYLQEQEENLRDWIKDDQAKLKAKQEELNQLKEMYSDIHGKHGNLVEKSAAIDIENQKLREARKYDKELIDAQREALEKFENTAQVDSHAIQRLQQQQKDDVETIGRLREERNSARAMYRSAQKEIDGLLNEKPRNRPSQPMKPVEALVREQDTDARLWANSFANQFDLPEDLDAEITGWFANAMQTAVDAWRNKGYANDSEKILAALEAAGISKSDLFDGLVTVQKLQKADFPGWTAVGQEIPKPEGWEDPFQYAKRLQEHLQEFINGMMKKLQPVLDTVGPIVAEVEKEYPGWMASNYQTKEEWWGTQTTKDEGISVRQHPDSDFKPLKTAGKDPDAYEFVNAPKHYNDHPSGVECQVIIRECKDPLIAIAFKHLWRTQWGNKPGQTVDQDLGKAVEYIQLEQARRAGKDRL